ERVAVGDVAAAIAGFEPVLALFRRAVGEAVGHHAAGRLLLQGIVADRAGGFQRLVDVAGFDQPAFLIGVVGPHAGEAVGLQFHPHGQGVGFALAHVGAGFADLSLDAQYVLHVMADLVGDHIGLREIAGRAEPARELVEEIEIEIDLLIAWAIERSDRRLREAAGGLGAAGEQHQLGLAILRADLRQELMPGVFGIGENDGDELLQLLVLRTRKRAAWRLLFDITARAEIAREQRQRIDAEGPGDDAQDDDAANPEAAPAHPAAAKSTAETAAREAHAAAHAAAVLDIAALPTAFPQHGSDPSVVELRARSSAATCGNTPADRGDR